MFDYATFNSIILSLFVIAGLAFLTYGGDWLCKGAASIAVILKINPVIIGLTVVSIATSMPELFTAFIATSDGNADLAVGNIIGSNIGNIGLIMGIAALIYPIRIHHRLIVKEMPILLAATMVFTAVCWNNEINRIEGILLAAGLAGYLLFLVKSAKNDVPDAADEEEDDDDMPEVTKSMGSALFWVLLGAAALAGGAEFLVGGSVEIADRLGVSQVLIGLTMVALGTSLPELAASVAAARRKQSSIIAGNIVGSNLFNILFVGGGVSSVLPLKVSDGLLQVAFPAMLLLTALLWLIFTTDRRVSRMEGTILLILYVLIILLSYFSESPTPDIVAS